VDVVCGINVDNWHTALAARALGRPLITQIGSTFLPRPARWILSPPVAMASDVVMSTGRSVGEAHPGVRRLGERFIPFFSPVDVDEFSPRAELRDRARRLLGLPSDACVVGTVGNVSPQKGHEYFVEAAHLLRKSGRDLYFVILGASLVTQGPYRERLQKQASDRGLLNDGRLQFFEPGSDVSTFAQAIDIFWMTSRERGEGVPTSVLEAMALSLPVVTTDTGAVREAVIDGTTGFVVTPDRPADVVRCTEVLLEDTELRRRMGEASRVRAEQEFALRRCASTHVHALELALSRGTTPAKGL
jgi:glycosyltransferase involved in cell wall biosynthesis